jgi:hypothetical protein
VHAAVDQFVVPGGHVPAVLQEHRVSSRCLPSRADRQS